MWTKAEAIALCCRIEAVCPAFGCHIALTGGLLYKEGDRKDCDLLFYRIREVETININGLFDALGAIGVDVDDTTDTTERHYGEDAWCFKAKYQGLDIDIFFPEICDTGSPSGPGIDALLADAEPMP